MFPKNIDLVTLDCSYALRENTSLFRLNHKLSYLSGFFVLIFLLSGGFLKPVSGQILPDSAKPLPDIILFAEGAGFIPFRESYRINYQTSLAGVPFELGGGVCFPLNPSLSGMFGIRYKRREALFVPDFRIKTLEIELGARDYLESEHEKDLRLYGSAGMLLARSTATGNIDAT